MANVPYVVITKTIKILSSSSLEQDVVIDVVSSGQGVRENRPVQNYKTAFSIRRSVDGAVVNDVVCRPLFATHTGACRFGIEHVS